MEWYYWAIISIALFIGEALTNTGFYLFFFAVSALIVSLLDAAGVASRLEIQALLFSLFAVLMLAFLRLKLFKMLFPTAPKADRDSMEGELAISQAEILVGGLGLANMRGTVWQARNVGTLHIPPGQKCIVRKASGIVLEIEIEAN